MNQGGIAQKLMSAGVRDENKRGGLNCRESLGAQWLFFEIKDIGGFNLYKVSGLRKRGSSGLVDPLS